MADGTTRVDFPNRLIIETTTKCNARCVMCPMGKMKRPKFMGDSEFCTLIDECVGHKIDEISLTGYGDPLCDTYLAERIAYISAKLPDTTVTVFTNGSLMTPDMSKRLLNAGLTSVTFSVDGVDVETYEQIRRGLKYREVESNIHRFVDINEGMGHPCHVRVHMTLMPLNFSQMGRFMAKWRNVVDEVTFAPCDGRGKEDREPMYQSLAQLGPCPVLFSTLNVMSDGDVVMCCQDFNVSVPMGNVFMDGIEKIWNSERFNRVRLLHHTGNKKLIPLCKDCETRY